MDQAIELGEYHVTRDPVNVDAYDSLGLAYRYSGQLDKAISAYRLVLSLSPDAAWEHAALGVVLLDKNDARSALVELEEPVERFRLWGSSMAHHALSQRPESDAALSELIEDTQRHTRTTSPARSRFGARSTARS